MWFRRNKVVFGEELISPSKVNCIAFKQIELFKLPKQRPSRQDVLPREPEELWWEKPALGWIKVNWDASIDK
jgi:hypothetical protein